MECGGGVGGGGLNEDSTDNFVVPWLGQILTLPLCSASVQSYSSLSPCEIQSSLW